MRSNTKRWLLFVLVASACTSEPERLSVTLSVSLGAEVASLDAAYVLPGDPTPLAEIGGVDVTWRDAVSGEVIASGSVADGRRVLVEPLGEGDPGGGGPTLADAGFELTLPVTPSGRGQLEVRFDGASGAERSVMLDVEPLGPAGASASPLMARTEGDVGARREALEECPVEVKYRSWDPGDVPNPPFPDDARSVFWGCAETVHLGGAEDPRGRLLIAVYPAAGPDGAWDRDSFVTTATEAIEGLLGRNDFFRRNADQFSFYGIVDPTVLANSTFGGCQAIVGGDGYTETLDMGPEGEWYWRTRGAAYGPVPRFEFSASPNRDFEVTEMIRPDIHLGLLNGLCSGWASVPGRLLIVGSRFNAFTGRMGTLPVDGSNVALVGDRIAHELGHAIGGLADEYGFNGDGVPTWNRCIGGDSVQNNAAGVPYPNLAARSCPVDDPGCSDPTPVPWECMIGAGHECPDHRPGSHSYVRETDAIDGRCGAIVTPCSDSLMRGFAALNPQYDPWADNVMSRAIGVAPAFSEDACGAACVGSCDGVQCGNDGCDGRCEDSCMCAGSVECLNALGGGVCPDTVDCARTLDLAQASISDPDDGIDCSDRGVFYRAEDRFMVARCNSYGNWVPADCTDAYDEIAACLAARPTE